MRDSNWGSPSILVSAVLDSFISFPLLIYFQLLTLTSCHIFRRTSARGATDCQSSDDVISSTSSGALCRWTSHRWQQFHVSNLTRVINDDSDYLVNETYAITTDKHLFLSSSTSFSECYRDTRIPKWRNKLYVRERRCRRRNPSVESDLSRNGSDMSACISSSLVSVVSLPGSAFDRRRVRIGPSVYSPKVRKWMMKWIN